MRNEELHGKTESEQTTKLLVIAFSPEILTHCRMKHLLQNWQIGSPQKQKSSRAAFTKLWNRCPTHESNRQMVQTTQTHPIDPGNAMAWDLVVA